jgi:hypothetical protein
MNYRARRYFFDKLLDRPRIWLFHLPPVCIEFLPEVTLP